MRRKEFALTEQYSEDVKAFIENQTYGVLAIQGDDYPIVKPLNYVYYNEAIYFHGSKAGEKMKALKEEVKATFAITEEYSRIPSYTQDDYFACPATAFFKSVIVKGTLQDVKDEREKHEALNELMKKLQKEGGYSPIVYEDEGYHKRVSTTAVLKLNVDELTEKFKFGQNWKQPQLSKTIEFLEQRNDHYDKQTVEMMERYCPHFKTKSE